jgi:hypothetical protein
VAKRKYIIGSGITQRPWQDELIETDAQVRRMNEEIDATFQWREYTAPVVEWLTQVRQEEIDAHGMWHWRAYEHKAWYAHMALIEHKNATKCVEKGDASAAACAAMRFGSLLTEMRIKFRHESDALFGAETKEQRKAGGAATRKRDADDKPISDEARVACYLRYRAMGLNKTDATSQAAEELRLSPASIRNARKGATASD